MAVEITEEFVWQSIPPLSLIHISEPTRLALISYAVFCLIDLVIDTCVCLSLIHI